MSAECIGVDVGGTKLAIAKLEDQALSEPTTLPTDRSSGDALIAQIAEVVGRVRGPEAVAVGVGVPSVIEFKTGKVRSSVNVPLKDVPLRQVLGERIGLPVFVDNDATLAALAEAHDGERFVHRDLVMFTVGTGVGGGLVLGGQVYRGATGAAAELGHTLIGLDLNGGAPHPEERFPQPGSLESLAAGRALDRLAHEASESGPAGILEQLAARGQEISGRDAVEAAQSGDAEAKELLELLGARLGIGIANAINTFDPEVVAIGGGVATAGELLLAPARETASRFVLPGVGERTEIRLARHGVQAGVRGAALLAALEVEAVGR